MDRALVWPEEPVQTWCEERLESLLARYTKKRLPALDSKSRIRNKGSIWSRPERTFVEPGVGEGVAAEPQRLGVFERTVAFIKELWSEKVYSKK